MLLGCSQVVISNPKIKHVVSFSFNSQFGTDVRYVRIYCSGLCMVKVLVGLPFLHFQFCLSKYGGMTTTICQREGRGGEGGASHFLVRCIWSTTCKDGCWRRVPVVCSSNSSAHIRAVSPLLFYTIFITHFLFFVNEKLTMYESRFAIFFLA